MNIESHCILCSWWLRRPKLAFRTAYVENLLALYNEPHSGNKTKPRPGGLLWSEGVIRRPQAAFLVVDVVGDFLTRLLIYLCAQPAQSVTFFLGTFELNIYCCKSLKRDDPDFLP